MNRLATYVEAPFPYPAAWQSDGYGNLIRLPGLRIPTSLVQGRRGPIFDAGGGDCKRLQRNARLGSLGCDPDNGDFDGCFGDPSGGCGGDADCGPGAVCNAGVCVPTPNGGGGGGGSTNPTNTSHGGGSLPGATGNNNSIASLINAGANVAGKILASTRGITPQQFALQNPQLSPAQAAAAYQQMLLRQQAPSSSFLTQNLAGIPVWGWGLGLIGAVLFAKGFSQ